MVNPVLVEVTRGERVESRHRGAIAVADAKGTIVFSVGDIEALVFPRSAVKPIQALPLIEGGAADAFGFGARELALAQASHNGEPAHVEGVAAMLRPPALTRARSNAGRMRRATGPRRRSSSAAASRRTRCTTIAPASMRTSSPSPASSASIPAAMSAASIRFSRRSGRRSPR
jgi:hypothetical protein